MEMQNAVIVLADISGYTRFIKLHGKALAHAESVINELMNSVIKHTKYPLILNKLEGDAALFYALANNDPQAVAKSTLHQVNGFFQAFSNRKQEIGVDAYCNCGACTEVVRLNIKAVMDYGEIVVRQVRRFEEISGTSVIIAHRLLKNSVPLDEYVLLTEAFEKALGEVPANGTHITEQCEGIGEVNAVYYSPPPFESLPPEPSIIRSVQLKIIATAHLVMKYIKGLFGITPKQVFRNLVE
jgi:hypothetical protein